MPDLVASMSLALRRRMRGKSCFNFASIDEPLLEELAGDHQRQHRSALREVAEIAPGKTPARSH